MSIPAISPVLARIQTIQSQFGMPSTNPAPQQTVDFASTLSAAVGASADPVTSGSSTGAFAQSLAPVLTGQLPNGTYATRIGSGAVVPGESSTAMSSAVPFADQFAAAGARYGVPADLLSAVGWVESRYRTDAVSSAGAIGVMQIMPFVADELGVDPTDPTQAIDGAARLLRSHYDRFGSWDLALAAYNAGAGAVKRAGNTMPSPNVAEYVRRVNERMLTS